MDQRLGLSTVQQQKFADSHGPERRIRGGDSDDDEPFQSTKTFGEDDGDDNKEEVKKDVERDAGSTTAALIPMF